MHQAGSNAIEVMRTSHMTQVANTEPIGLTSDAYALSVLCNSFNINLYVLIRVIPCTGDAAHFVWNHVASTHERVLCRKPSLCLQ